MTHHPDTPGREAEEVSGVACNCITCGDVATPMRVLKIDLDRELALCADETEAHHTIEIALVQPVSVGDELLVHAGTAIGREVAA